MRSRGSARAGGRIEEWDYEANDAFTNTDASQSRNALSISTFQNGLEMAEQYT